MPSNSQQPTEVDLSQLLERLCASGIEFILVGGLAAVIQGSPITTMDVDIVHNRTPDNIERLVSFLENAEAMYRRPDDKVIKPVMADLSGMGHMLLTTRMGPLDVLSFIEGRKTYEELIDHTVKIPFRGYILRVLDLTTMLELKRSTSNPKEQQRIAILEETIRQVEKDR
jgi:hypothetical protein